MELPFELDALAKANQYQKWIFESVQPFLGKRILELGSGIGNLSKWLPDQELLVLSEVDQELINILKLEPRVAKKKNLQILKLDLDQKLTSYVSQFQLDTIVSFNVMEHVENDLASIKEQVEVLKVSQSKLPKKLVIFVPAHNFAYGSLDKIFKHFRRYDSKMMIDIFASIDPTLKPHIRYFNVLSFLGWIIQGKLVKTTVIKESQIKLLEKIIPFWKPVDAFLTKFLRLPFGQSLICVVEIK